MRIFAIYAKYAAIVWSL